MNQGGGDRRIGQQYMTAIHEHSSNMEHTLKQGSEFDPSEEAKMTNLPKIRATSMHKAQSSLPLRQRGASPRLNFESKIDERSNQNLPTVQSEAAVILRKQVSIGSAYADEPGSANTMLDTFSRVMTVQQPNLNSYALLNQASNLKKKFQLAMQKNDAAIERNFQPRSMSEQNLKQSNSAVKLSVSNNDGSRVIQDIYKEFRHSLDYLLKQLTKQSRPNNQTLLNSSLMSLQQIININTANYTTPDLQNQLIQYYDTESRKYLIRLHQNQYLNEQSNGSGLNSIQIQEPQKRIHFSTGIFIQQEMSKQERKKMKVINRIFQNRNDEHLRSKTHDNNGLEDETNQINKQRTEQDQYEPIYFDELSLSKFIEDYLDYQIEYAYGELAKISDIRNPNDEKIQHSNTANIVTDLTDNIPLSGSRDNNPLSKTTNFKEKAGTPNKLAANFLKNIGGGEDTAPPKVGTDPGFSSEKFQSSGGRPHHQDNRKKQSAPIISEVIMLLEVDRLIFKSFNTLIAVQMKTEAKKISDFLQEQRTGQDSVQFSLPTSQKWQDESQTLELFMTYVKESLKFILFSFFKRCRIIIEILKKYKDSRSQDTQNSMPSDTGDSSNNQKQTRESIIADMLAQNLKWAFLTILTCIEKSEAYSHDKQEQMVSKMQNINDTQDEPISDQMPIMADLICFKDILSYLQEGLNHLGGQDYKNKDSRYYKNTLEKLINRLFIKEEEDGVDGDEPDLRQNPTNNLLTHKNQLLEKIKQQLLLRGQYQEVDQKCQSFKSFINLMETNQLFKELRSDPKKVTGDIQRDIQRTPTMRGAFNNSFHMGSMHSGVDLENKSHVAENLADAMLNSLASDMGIQLPKNQLSVGASSARGSIQGGIRKNATPNRSIEKHSSEYVKKRELVDLKQHFDDDDGEGEVPESGRTNQTNLQVKSRVSDPMDNQLKALDKKPKDRSVTFSLPKSGDSANLAQLKKQPSNGGLMLPDDNDNNASERNSTFKLM